VALALTTGRRISSRSTFFLKRVFPLLWFGIIALFVVVAVLSSRRGPRSPPLPLLLIGPAVMVLVVYTLVRRLIFDLADEVYDEGDALRVRFGADEERIPLENIINISYAGLSNPARATLTLRDPGRFGREITFAPQQRVFGPLLRLSNPLISELIERVDAARRRQ